MSDKKRVYLDYAATTPVRSEVLEVMLDIYNNNFGNPSSFYQEGQKAAKIIDQSR